MFGQLAGGENGADSLQAEAQFNIVRDSPKRRYVRYDRASPASSAIGIRVVQVRVFGPVAPRNKVRTTR